MSKIPELKKKIFAFMNCEEGKISKEKIVKVGGFITTLAIGNILLMPSALSDCMGDGGHDNSGDHDCDCGSHSNEGGTGTTTTTHIVNHANQVSCTSTGTELTSITGHANGAHTHHGSHGNHTAHGSHGSHSSHGNSGDLDCGGDDGTADATSSGMGGGSGTSGTSGDGDSCFVAGTKILLQNFDEKNIELIKIGEIILTWNILEKKFEDKTVLKIDSYLHEGGMVEIIFDNKITNINTPCHRYYIKNKGWCAVDTSLAKKRYKTPEEPEKIELGDKCLFIDKDNPKGKWITVKKIINYKDNLKVYNITSVKDNHNFFVNGLLVHNCK